MPDFQRNTIGEFGLWRLKKSAVSPLNQLFGQAYRLGCHFYTNS